MIMASCVMVVCASTDPGPIITSSPVTNVAENAMLAHALTASEAVTWGLDGGPDLSQFEISGSILRWVGNGTRDFEIPTDFNYDNVYRVIVSATDTAFNVTLQTIDVTVTDIDDTNPMITSGNTDSVPENIALAHTLTANETVTWSIVGGADAARFEISGSTLRWLGDGVKDFENPNDADLNNSYVVTVRATDLAGNPTDQTVTVTVTDVGEFGLTFLGGINTNVVLADGNLSLVANPSGVSMGIASAGWKNAGKWYFETLNADVGSTNDGFGLVPENAESANIQSLNYTMNCLMVFSGSGTIVARGYPSTQGYPGASLGAVAINNRVCFAVDLDNWRFWARKIATIPATWSPTDKSATITLSNGDLTATYTGGFGNGTVRTAIGRSSGKWYWEITYVHIEQLNTSTGLTSSSTSLPIQPGTANGQANVNGGGVVWINGTTPGVLGGGSIGSLSDGSIVRVAVDLDAKLIWFRVSGGGNVWNGNAAADPATGIGGLSIAAMTFPAHPYFTGSNVAGQGATANFGASTFIGTIPSGFSAWATTGIIGIGNWNNNAAADPAANTGGIDISYFSQTRLAPMGMFIDGSGASGAKWTFNFGATAFAGIVPSGFAAGWSAGADIAIGHPTYGYLTTTLVAGRGLIEKGERLGHFGRQALGDLIHVGLGNFKNSGKFYIECKLLSTYSFAGFGFATHSVSMPDVGIGDMKQMATVDNIGRVWSNNVNTGLTIGTPAVEDIIGAAIDFDNDKIWYRIAPSGNWNGQAIGSQNPATNTGGASMSSYAAKIMGPAIWLSGVATLVYILNTGERPFSGAVPAGFTSGWPLGGAPLPLTTWDSGTVSNVTLSNGNLTATHSNTTDNSGARSTAGKNGGKLYFEVAATDLDGNADAIGIITAAGTFTNFVTNGTNCAAVYRNTGNIFTNNANSGRTLGALVDGDVIGVAVDLDNDKVWFRKAPSGLWNGQAIGSQDPAANIGGASISSFSSTTMAPAIGFGGPSTQAGDNMTANFGATAFVGAVPTGFTAGWPT
jgi:hypothetical protein